MSNSITALARAQIRNLVPYSAASYADGLVRLNANETPWQAPGDAAGRDLNRYPPERPLQLTEAMAAWYGVETEKLLVTRGSSEGIDLLIRAFCHESKDAIVICPPTFGMYRVYADIQGARVHEVPLRQAEDFALDADELVRNWPDDGKILFLCSPNNPTGNRIATEELLLIARLLSGKALVVVDAAYAEFGDEDPTTELLTTRETNNIVVLRTLSKAFGLAGARCGALLGPAELVSMLGCMMPPYALSTPCIQAIMPALSAVNRSVVEDRVALIRKERMQLAKALSAMSGVTNIYPSEANFLLVQAADSARFIELARSGRVLLRDFSAALSGCIRVTVGTPEENLQLLQSLESL